jgi:hypothetical protein
MKKLAIMAALGLTATLAFGQGQITFVTSTLGANARVRDANGAVIGDTANTAGFGIGANGTNFFAQLWVAPGANALESALVPANNQANGAISPVVNIRNGANAGWVQQSGTTSLGVVFNAGTLTTTVSVQGAAGGGPATVQLRVWYSLGNTITSWAQAIASNDPNMRLGKSALLSLPGTGDPAATPTPGLPVALTGLTGFTLVPVPEPSSFALAGLGMASLLIFRRRK